MECTATPYDAVNRLVSVDGGATASYAYDYANRRVKKVNWEGSTHYIWEGSQVIAEHNASTGVQIIDYVYAGNRLIAKGPGSQLAGNGNMTYVLSDRLSARVLMDTFGTVTGRQGHLPFGEEFAVSGTLEKHRFTSYEQDSETGTDYAVNRQYAQGVGRFMRTDPYRRSYEFENPQSLNRYAYIGNDPINSIDPLGLCGSVTLLPGGGVRVCYPVGVDGCYCDDFLMPIDEGQRKERINIIVVEKKCSTRRLPINDPDKMDMIRVIMHEATPASLVGTPEYQNGDRTGHPTGRIMTEQVLEQEAANIAGVIRNFANNHRVSIHDAIFAIAHSDDKTTEEVLSDGQGYIDKALEDSNDNPKGWCAKLKRAIKAVNGEVAPDIPTTFEQWRGQEQGDSHPRRLRPGQIRHGRTDFMP